MTEILELDSIFLMLMALLSCLFIAVLFFLSALTMRTEETCDRRLGYLVLDQAGTKHRHAEPETLSLSEKVKAMFWPREVKDLVLFDRSENREEQAPTRRLAYQSLLIWRAGKYRHWPMQWRVFLVAGRIFCSLVVVSAFMIAERLGYLSSPGSISWFAGLGLAVITGFCLPDYCVRAITKKRTRHFEEMAPDMVDLLLLSVEAGMTFDNALVETRSSLSLYSPKLAKEMERLSAEMVILPSRSAAFSNLVKRTGSETLRYLSVAFTQGEKYGAPIAASLKVVAQESRKRSLIALEQKASRLPVLLSIPLMIFILPPVVLISAGPGFITLMRSIGGAG